MGFALTFVTLALFLVRPTSTSMKSLTHAARKLREQKLPFTIRILLHSAFLQPFLLNDPSALLPRMG